MQILLTLLIIILLAISACGPVENRLQYEWEKSAEYMDRQLGNNRFFEESDPFFDVYKNKFEEYINRDMGRMPINFVNSDHPIMMMQTDVAGACVDHSTTFLLDFKEILVNRNTWDKYTEEQKWTLIFHELAHCVLDWAEHDDTKFDPFDFWSCPKSIMHSNMIPEWCLNEDGELDYYLNQVRQPKREKLILRDTNQK